MPKPAVSPSLPPPPQKTLAQTKDHSHSHTRCTHRSNYDCLEILFFGIWVERLPTRVLIIEALLAVSMRPALNYMLKTNKQVVSRHKTANSGRAGSNSGLEGTWLRPQPQFSKRLKRLLPFLNELSRGCLQHGHVRAKPVQDAMSTWGWRVQRQ